MPCRAHLELGAGDTVLLVGEAVASREEWGLELWQAWPPHGHALGHARWERAWRPQFVAEAHDAPRMAGLAEE